MEKRDVVVNHFDLSTGLSSTTKPMQRRLSDMAKMFSDQGAVSSLLEKEDPLLYEFFDMGVPFLETEVAYGTSITYPGKVGREFNMTKGHFHERLETSEIYFCLRGYGLMLMENPEGHVQWEEFHPGHAVYVPARYAHRSINLHPTEPLVTFFAFPGDAGHDYGTIETRGFRKIVLDGPSGYELADNPAWSGN